MARAGWMGGEFDRDEDRWEQLPLAQRIVALVSALRAQDGPNWHAAAVKQVEMELASESVPTTPRTHKLDCDEYHAHRAPKCCAVDCWCLEAPSAALPAARPEPPAAAETVFMLRDIVESLRTRTWLSPVSAEEMNRRDRWLADHIERAAVHAQKGPRDAHGLVRNLLSRLPYPDRLHCPSVVVEDDGELGFDWDMAPNATVTASLAPNGSVGFAALIGDWKAHGRFQLPAWDNTFNEAMTRLGEFGLKPAASREDQTRHEEPR